MQRLNSFATSIEQRRKRSSRPDRSESRVVHVRRSLAGTHLGSEALRVDDVECALGAAGGRASDGAGEALDVARAGGDHVESVAEHVREHERERVGGRGQARQAPAFHLRELRAHSVQLVDAASAARQQTGRQCLLGERNRRHRQRKKR